MTDVFYKAESFGGGGLVYCISEVPARMYVKEHTYYTEGEFKWVDYTDREQMAVHNNGEQELGRVTKLEFREAYDD